MAEYTNDLRLKEIGTGESSGTWGTETNTNLELIAEAFSYGTEASFGSDADATTTIADGATDPARSLYLKVTSGASLTATRTLTIAPNTVSKIWIIENATSGSQSINISQGSGANVTIPNGDVKVIYSDGAGSGAAVVDAFTDLNTSGTLTATNLAGTLTTAAQPNITSLGTLTTLTVDDITINGSTISDAGDLTIDVAGDITLDADGGDIFFKDGGTAHGNFLLSGSDFTIGSSQNNGDLIFRGIDGGADVTALTLDMSDAGTAIFNNNLVIPASIYHTGDTDTFFGFQSADTFTVNTNGSERMRIDSSGKVAIGDTSAGTYQLKVDSGSNGTSDALAGIFVEGQRSGVVYNLVSNNTANAADRGSGIQFRSAGFLTSGIIGRSDAIAASGDAPGYLTFHTSTDNSEDFAERMRIDSSGRLGVGCTPTDFATEIQATSGGNALKLRGRSAGGNEGWLAWTDNAGNVEAAMYATADNLIFANTTSYTERMRIDASGNVGIGVTSSYPLTVQSGTAGSNHAIALRNNSTNNLARLGFLQQDSATAAYTSIDGDGRSTGSLRFNTNDTERMRIDADGIMLLGTTTRAIGTAGNVNKFGVAGGSNSAFPMVVFADQDTSVEGGSVILELSFDSDISYTSANYVLFTDQTATQGSISGTGNQTVSFNTSSDRRLKENIVDTGSQLEKIKQIEVRDFNYIGNDITTTGMIAQELNEIIPNVVVEGQEDFKKHPWSIDYGKLTPYLIKAIQEQQEQIEELKKEIETFKN